MNCRYVAIPLLALLARGTSTIVSISPPRATTSSRRRSLGPYWMQLKSCRQGEQLGRSVASMEENMIQGGNLWQICGNSGFLLGKCATNSWLKLEDGLKMPAFFGEVEPGGELDLAGDPCRPRSWSAPSATKKVTARGSGRCRGWCPFSGVCCLISR